MPEATPQRLNYKSKKSRKKEGEYIPQKERIR